MADQVILFLNQISLSVTFISNILIFLGGFYVAIHSRTLPIWAVTCIWYLGLSSLLISLTVCMGWIFGDYFPLSYANLQIVCDLIQRVILATTVVLLFTNTVYTDFKYRKNRKLPQNTNL